MRLYIYHKLILMKIKIKNIKTNSQSILIFILLPLLTLSIHEIYKSLQRPERKEITYTEMKIRNIKT